MGANFAAATVAADALRGAISGLSSGIRSAVNDAAALEKAITEITTISDISTRQLSDATLGLSKAYGGEAQAQAKAYYQTISAGITDAAKAHDLLDTANKLALGGVTDVTTAVDGLTSAVNAYKESGLTAREASDTMFVAIKRGKTTAEELSRSLGQVLPIASQLGVSFDEVAAAVATITLNGVETSEAVTQLRSILVALAKQTKKSQKEAARLGVDFSIAGLRAKGLSDFLVGLTKSTNFADESFVRLFGRIEGAQGAMALTAQEASALNDIFEDMAAKTGNTDDAAAKMADTFSFQQGRLGAALRDVSIQLGKLVTESDAGISSVKLLTSAMDGFAGSLKKFGESEMQKAIAAVAIAANPVTGLAVVQALLLDNVFSPDAPATPEGFTFSSPAGNKTKPAGRIGGGSARPKGKRKKGRLDAATLADDAFGPGAEINAFLAFQQVQLDQAESAAAALLELEIDSNEQRFQEASRAFEERQDLEARHAAERVAGEKALNAQMVGLGTDVAIALSQVVGEAFVNGTDQMGQQLLALSGQVVTQLGVMTLQAGIAGLAQSTIGLVNPLMAVMTGGPAGQAAALGAIATGTAMIGVGAAMGAGAAAMGASASRSPRGAGGGGRSGGGFLGSPGGRGGLGESFPDASGLNPSGDQEVNINLRLPPGSSPLMTERDLGRVIEQARRAFVDTLASGRR